MEFIKEYVPPERSVWKRQDAVMSVEWADNQEKLPEGSAVRLVADGGRTLVFSPSMKIIGEVQGSLVSTPRGVLVAKITSNAGSIAVRYFGPEPIAEIFV